MSLQTSQNVHSSAGKLILQIVLVFVLVHPTGVAQDAVAADDSQQAELSVPALAAKIKPSLVAIRIVGRDGREASFATGFVISKDGLIATAYHSVAEGFGIRVETESGRNLPVTHIHARLQSADLVVLRVAADDLVPLVIADSSNVADGQSVVAVGHPRGQRNSVASGLVSRRETINSVEMLQLSMPIERGSSGEPVVDRRGNVIAVVTLKAAEQTNVGFAVPAVHLQQMLKDPSPISITRWETIGRLPVDDWSILWNANWRQHGTDITVDGYGKSFGGRSLCLSSVVPPEIPFELQVDVKLDDESGAAGLAFHSDGKHRHYGFYPSAGKIRMTRFGGPTLGSWTILHNEAHSAYKPGQWNTLKVRVEQKRRVCFVNDEQVYSTADDRLPTGSVGLAVFRGTKARFRRFRVATSIPSLLPEESVRRKIDDILKKVKSSRPAAGDIVEQLLPFQQYSSRILNTKAVELERQAKRMRQLADDVHTASIIRDIKLTLQIVSTDSETPATPPDVFRAGLLIAALDNPDLEIETYVGRVARLASEASATLADDSTEAERLAAVDKLLFEEYGFRGSQFEYNEDASSYLNQVIDDREGLPIALSVLYMEVCKRLKLTIEGVGLPGHFVVRFQPTDDEEASQLIDVFHRGRRLSKKDAEKLVLTRGFPPEPQLFEAQSPVEIASGMVVNLLGRAEEKKDDDRVYRYLELLGEINPDSFQYRGQRMLIRAQTGRFHEALNDVNWLLKHPVDNVETEQLYELRAEFERQAEKQASVR